MMLSAAVLVVLTATFALAQEGEKNVMLGKITKVEGNKITFQAYDRETKKLGEAKEMQTAENAKYFEQKGKEKQAVSGGLQADAFKNLGAQGHWAAIRVEGDRVSEIRLLTKLEDFTAGNN